MSIFSKFKSKKATVIDIPPEAEPSAPLPNEFAKIPDSDGIEPIYSEPNLLRALYPEENTYPEVLQAVSPHITRIQESIRLHLESIDSYREWERIIAEPKPADASETSDASAACGTFSASQASGDMPGAPEASDDAGEKLPPPVPASDASVTVFSSDDKMFGFLYCTAPIGDGKDVDQGQIEAAVADYGIKHGIIEGVCAGIAGKKDYNTIYLIAHGTPPVNGKDGEVKDRFLRTQEIRLEENERGRIDYKDLHLFQNIAKGDVICDLIPPVEGQDGCNIMGKPIPAAVGKMPAIPQGKNTIVNEENTALIAEVDGDLSFQKNVFRVEPQLVIPGNVDNSTGNINFTGDVLVKGDVLRGYKVNAGSNILVLGMAEAAILTAGGDIELRKGMNGNGLGTLTAGGDVNSRFLEQTQVTAGGNVVTETIINCQIVSGGNIIATSGKGIIIGGVLTAKYSIEANRIGSLSNTRTILKLGVSTENEENVEYLAEKLQQSKDALEKINKNLVYLNGLPSLPPDKAEIYRILTEQKHLHETLTKDLQFKINTINSKAFDYSQCHVHGNMIYGITEVYLNGSKMCIRDTTTKCSVYVANGELMLGTF